MMNATCISKAATDFFTYFAGKLARKAKALRNSVKVVANPPGNTVNRMQVAVTGIVDPLSNVSDMNILHYRRAVVLVNFVKIQKFDT